MSLGNVATRARSATTRATLTAALGTVPGVTAYPNVPDQPVAGAGWVKLVQVTYNAGPFCAPGAYTYEVFLTLPADYLAETVDQGDEFLDVLVPALWPLVVVQYAEPVAIQFNDRQSMPGLRLRVITR